MTNHRPPEAVAVNFEAVAVSGSSGRIRDNRFEASRQASRPTDNWQTSPARNEIYATHWLALQQEGQP